MTKILIVDDEAPNVEILTRLLNRSKYEVLVAGTRDDAVAIATAEMPSLILMDIGIPNAAGEPKNIDGGLEATQQLKSAESTKAIPIIALTASAMLDEKNRFLDAGCDAVQSKPYSFGPLLDAIKSYLN
ncbi:MAG: response regulator [Planctomycetota bacterium]|nr:response regulator [Planctomycetota bacterium]